MVLLESLESRERTPWMLQLVFNEILTFPLDQIWVGSTVVVRKMGGGEHPPPPLHQPSMLNLLLQYEHTTL